ncbi:hypothetical protein LCGC14_1712730, partial [marine sediment metagenome]
MFRYNNVIAKKLLYAIKQIIPLKNHQKVWCVCICFFIVTLIGKPCLSLTKEKNILLKSGTSMTNNNDSLIENDEGELMHSLLIDKDFDERKQIAVKNINGQIVLCGSSEKRIHIKAEKELTISANMSPDDKLLRDHFEKIDIKISVDDDVIEITVFEPNEIVREANVKVNIYIHLPYECVVDAELANGDVSVSELSNKTQIKASNGNVYCNNLSGPLHIKLANGLIRCRECTHNVNISCVNGNISLLNSDKLETSQAIGCQLSNGNIEMAVHPSSS